MSSLSVAIPPGLRLSPPPDAHPQHLTTLIPSFGISNSYSPMSSRQLPLSQMVSPLEEALTMSRLLVGHASSSLASDSGSEHVSNSGESAYLTPPQSQGDNEKAPYKARSLSSASLNMTSNYTGRRKHRKHARKRYPKHKQKPRSENDTDHERDTLENHCHMQDALPHSEDRYLTGKVSERIGDRIRTSSNSIRGLKKKGKGIQVMSTAAIGVTTRKWSSVGIDTDSPPRKASVKADHKDNKLLSDDCNISNNWNHNHENQEIMKLVRARLTSHEINTDHQPTPATITLRRASGVPADRSSISVPNLEGYPNSSVLSSSRGRNETRPYTSTYLITTDDIVFISNLIQSGFDVRKTTVNFPEPESGSSRKPSITSRGMLVECGAPAELATTITDIHEVPKRPQLFVEDPNFPMMKPARVDTRSKSHAISLPDVPEIIWEDTRSKESRHSSSKASCSSEEQVDSMHASRVVWPNSPHEKLLRGFQDMDCDGDQSPTSRVFQWVFKESTDKLRKEIEPLEKLAEPVKDSGPPITLVKKKSFPLISLFNPDVFSFPPLPARKFTSDWISPLPDMNTTSSGSSKSLYQHGIDSQLGNSLNELSITTSQIQEQKTKTDEIEQQRLSPASGESGLQVRRKCAALLHPQSLSRVGDSFTVGSALGCSSGARRKSSTSSMHVKTHLEPPTHTLDED